MVTPAAPKTDIAWLRDRVHEVTKCVHEDVMPVVKQMPKILPAIEAVKITQTRIKDDQVAVMKGMKCLKDEVVNFKDDFDNRYKPFLESEILTRVRWQEKTQKIQTALLTAISLSCVVFLFALFWDGALMWLRMKLGISQ